MDVELRQLRALVAVVDEGTFTDAAIALGVSQAAVSRAVAALEAALGARVLHRTSREVTPTAFGARAVRDARAVLDRVAALRRAAAADADEIRVGYAWSALGRHTTTVQRRWAAGHPGSSLVFVQSHTLHAGLGDGSADVAVLRLPLPGRALPDRRFRTVPVGTEQRYAAVAAGDPLARRRSVTLADLSDRTLALDAVTGTTVPELWAAGQAPGRSRPVQGVDEWLTLVAAGQAVGITSEATVRQHPRPGVAYRKVRDAPPIEVLLGWRKDDRPQHLDALAALVREVLAPNGSAPGGSARGPRAAESRDGLRTGA
jgi:DNA-binding transcriptional LysR family regulator